jgi:hypothetical protein
MINLGKYVSLNNFPLSKKNLAMHLLATHFLDPVLEKERNRALTC